MELYLWWLIVLHELCITSAGNLLLISLETFNSATDLSKSNSV